jgi:hypothetical protein
MALSEIRYTLVTDGPTDSVLLRHIDWVISQHTSIAVRSIWADLSRLRHRPRNLVQRIQTALDLYPCDMLCVHRDAERDEPSIRVREIQSAASALHLPTSPIVCVVPVRMQEAWLLFDESAIKKGGRESARTCKIDSSQAPGR